MTQDRESTVRIARRTSCVVLAALILLLASTSGFGDEAGNIDFDGSVLQSPTPCSNTLCHGPDNFGSFTQGPQVALTGLPASYSGGEVFSLTLIVNGGGGGVFGFQIIAVFDDKAQAGSLAPVTPGLRFRLYNTPQGPVQYLSHQFPLNSDSVEFRWTAPETAERDVTFKFASNAANGDGDNTFDSIFFNTQVIQAATTPVGDPPTAIPDEKATVEETPVVIDVLANDTDPENDTLSVKAASDPPNGSTAVNGDSTVTYTPDDGFFGQDQFEYTLSDGQGNEVQGQVTVTVTPFEPALAFPQFVNGVFNGPNASRIVVRSTDDDEHITGFIRFRPSLGPDTVPVGGEDVVRVEFDLAPFGVFEINTDGAGGFQVGVVEVVVLSGDDSRIQGTLVFFLLGNFVSVDAAPIRDQHQVFISAEPIPVPGPDPDTVSEKSGVAAYNPDEENAATLRLVLLDEGGNERAARTVALDSRTQLVAFVDEPQFFPNFFQGNPTFRGSLNITVVEGPDIAVVGLIQKGSGALIAFSTAARAFVDE